METLNLKPRNNGKTGVFSPDMYLSSHIIPLLPNFFITLQKHLYWNTMNVKIETTLGDIVVRLYDETPLHRDNFVKLAKEGYYDGTLFHRVMAQVA